MRDISVVAVMIPRRKPRNHQDLHLESRESKTSSRKRDNKILDWTRLSRKLKMNTSNFKKS